MYPPGRAILYQALAFNAIGESLRVALGLTLEGREAKMIS
jgi:ABC-type dipeptide/oligopeptide/nickel transport system permease subunit